MKATILLFSSLFLAFAPATRAVTIWDNGTPDQTNAHLSDLAYPGQSGDDFTLATTETAGQIQWWGVYGESNTPTAPDDFTIRFFTITGGVPATVPLFSYAVGDVGKVDSGLNVVASDIYAYSATIPDTTLLAGSYLLSIVNNTAADTDDAWFWATSSQAGTSWFRNFEAQDWFSIRESLAFNISGPAEVPDTGASALLLGVGFLTLAAFRRALLRVDG